MSVEVDFILRDFSAPVNIEKKIMLLCYMQEIHDDSGLDEVERRHWIMCPAGQARGNTVLSS